MKIIEVRDGFIKFEADESIYLSSFIQTDGTDKSYIAQVNRLKKIGNVIICSAKILFILANGELRNYDKTEPPKDAEVKNFDFSNLQATIQIKKPIIAGKTLDNKNNITIDFSAFNKKMLISVDSQEVNNILVRNLSKQFNNIGVNTVIVDTLGVINAKKYYAGKDFKLPLDKYVLDFMYKACLNDATADSKNTIIEIFKDLSEYSESVPFVPFGTLKTVVDDLVDKQHIFKLFILKNKLAKFEQLGYFATKKEEVENIDKIIDSELAIIDLSKLDTLFQNYYIEYIYKKFDKKNVQVFFETANTVSKKNLKLITVDSDVSTTLITHSHYNYLNDIKSLFDNFIVENTVSNSQLFKLYSSFFESMKPQSYLITGESINYIPIASNAQIIDDFIPYEEKTPVKDEFSDTQITNEPVKEEIIVEEEESEKEVDVDDYTEFIEENQQEDDIQELENDEDDSYSQAENEDNELQEKSTPTNEEVMLNIDEKSESAINSISESIEEPQDMDLFDDNENNNIESEEFVEENEPKIQEDVDDIIEPEYSEIEELSLSEDTQQQELEQNDEDNTLEPDSFIEDEQDELPEYDDSLDNDISDMELSDFDNNLELEDSIDSEESDDLIEQSEDMTLELDKNDELLLQDLSEEDSNSDIENSSNNSEFEHEMQVLPINDNEDDLQNFDELTELDNIDGNDTDIIVDITDDNEEDIIIDEEKEREISADVDKVYSTLKSNDELEEISDSDLDLIDALNSDEDNSLDEFTEDLDEISDNGIDDGILDQPQESIVPQRQHREDDNTGEILEKRDSNTPIVPVYDADIPPEDMVVSDPIQQGDSVVHAKYGNGVVEKMIKYGNKTLFSINFENIGRRLLDPTLTEIKKI